VRHKLGRSFFLFILTDDCLVTTHTLESVGQPKTRQWKGDVASDVTWFDADVFLPGMVSF
jgi:hypothetical protein